MEKVFAEMFSRQADEIINGDYFYHIPWFDKTVKEYTGFLSKDFTENQINKLLEKKTRNEEVFKEDFKRLWEEKSLQGDFNPVIDERWLESIKGKNKDTKAEEIINKLTYENKIFMDIASSSGMGLAPYFIKVNPQNPYLITDISADEMKCLRSCINEHLAEYNINLASFDNCDIPIKDESLDCITSRHGITSSSGEPEYSSKINIYQFSNNREKPINEVYRILKQGGYFITLEMNTEYDYDLQSIYKYYNKHGKLFGIYTYDEIQAVCALLTEEPWRDKFVSAGFQVEVEKKYYQKYSLYRLMNFLHGFTNYYGIRHWEKRTWNEEVRAGNSAWKYSDYKDIIDNIGMDFYHLDAFYILRKPFS